MDTLHDRLAELAEDAPRGGAPAAELWARGKRAYRLRAAALAAVLLVVGALGTGIGVRLADGDGNRSGLVPAGTVGFPLSPDGRMIAYSAPTDVRTASTPSWASGELIVRDLVSGEDYSPLAPKF